MAELLTLHSRARRRVISSSSILTPCTFFTVRRPESGSRANISAGIANSASRTRRTPAAISWKLQARPRSSRARGNISIGGWGRPRTRPDFLRISHDSKKEESSSRQFRGEVQRQGAAAAQSRGACAERLLHEPERSQAGRALRSRAARGRGAAVPGSARLRGGQPEPSRGHSGNQPCDLAQEAEAVRPRELNARRGAPERKTSLARAGGW